MSTDRLRARIPGAEPAGAARIEGFELVCNKRGKDGSGKANLVEASASAWGVLFRVTHADWTALDRFEWGYARHTCRVFDRADTPLDAQLYLALAPEPRDIPPYDWYRAHCLDGAREHDLPGDVIATIESWAVEIARR